MLAATAAGTRRACSAPLAACGQIMMGAAIASMLILML